MTTTCAPELLALYDGVLGRTDHARIARTQTLFVADLETVRNAHRIIYAQSDLRVDSNIVDRIVVISAALTEPMWLLRKLPAGASTDQLSRIEALCRANEEFANTKTRGFYHAFYRPGQTSVTALPYGFRGLAEVYDVFVKVGGLQQIGYNSTLNLLL